MKKETKKAETKVLIAGLISKASEVMKKDAMYAQRLLLEAMKELRKI